LAARETIHEITRTDPKKRLEIIKLTTKLQRLQISTTLPSLRISLALMAVPSANENAAMEVSIAAMSHPGIRELAGSLVTTYPVAFLVTS
jgi:hypothetical protein